MTRATDKQVWLIKRLGRELGLLVEGDAADMAHVLSVGTYGRVAHWASLTLPEASLVIARLKGELPKAWA